MISSSRWRPRTAVPLFTSGRHDVDPVAAADPDLMRVPERGQCRPGARLDVAKVEHGNLEHVVFWFENVIHDGEVGVETIQNAPSRWRASVRLGCRAGYSFRAERLGQIAAPPRSSQGATSTRQEQGVKRSQPNTVSPNRARRRSSLQVVAGISAG